MRRTMKTTASTSATSSDRGKPSAFQTQMLVVLGGPAAADPGRRAAPRVAELVRPTADLPDLDHQIWVEPSNRRRCCMIQMQTNLDVRR